MRGTAGPGRFAPVGAAVLLMICGPAQAHDPFEITTEARVKETSLDVEITMARSTSLLACEVHGPARTFDPQKFPELRPLLAPCGARLYVILAGGKALALRKAEVDLTIENDVVWRLTYARPTRSPLRFTATVLQKMPPEGYGVSLTVEVKRGLVPAGKILWRDDTTLDVPLAP